MKIIIAILGLCLVSPAALARADVYKCQDAGGGLRYSENPCAQSAKMLPYSKLTKNHHEYQLHQVAQQRKFKAQHYEQRRRYYQMAKSGHADSK